MKMFWPRNYPKDGVLSIVMWLFVASRIFGLLPFSVEYDVKRKRSQVKVTALDCFCFVIAIIIYALLVRCMVQSDPFPKLYSSIELSVRISTIIAGISIAIYSVITDMINRTSVWSIVTNLTAFDEKVNMDCIIVWVENPSKISKFLNHPQKNQ